MEMIPSPRLGFLRGVFLAANHLASSDDPSKGISDVKRDVV